jgi:CubicO group peptidase (beta-lactamase class C family)
MTSTSVKLLPENRARLATAYGRRLPDVTRALMPFTDTRGITPAANMSSTAADLARYAMLQMRESGKGGAQILKASTLREMQRVHWLEADWKNAWGLGFAVRRLGERSVFGHGGAVAGYRTQITVCPAEKVAVVVMTNADDGRPGRFVAKAFEWVAPAIVKAFEPEKKPDRALKEWANYVGVYRSLWGDTQVMIHEGHLVMFDPTVDNPRDEMYRLTPEGPHTFRLNILDGEGGELVVFEPGPDGKAVRLRDPENYSNRVEY